MHQIDCNIDSSKLELDIVIKSLSYNCICSFLYCIVLPILYYSYIVLLITVLAVLLNYLLKLTYSGRVSYVFILDVRSSAFLKESEIYRKFDKPFLE